MSHDLKELDDAAKDLVRKFPGRGDALGALLGKGKGVLNNEINPKCTHAKLGFKDAVRAEKFAQRYPLLYAHARVHGFICYRLPAPALFAGDASLLEAFSSWQAANGKTCDEIRAAVDPDSPAGPGITWEEVERIADAADRSAIELIELVVRFRQVAEPDDGAAAQTATR